MTFHSQGYYKQLAIQAGTNYFFNKVDDFEEITKVVETLCKREEFSFR
jgi:hypothetical protein